MNAAYTEEQYKLASPHAWIWLLEVAVAGEDTLRYTNNNSNIAWYGNTYTRMPFTVDDLSIANSGKFPEYRLTIGDTGLSSTLRELVWDTGGCVDGTVRLMVVHSDHLAVTTPAVDEVAEILGCDVTLNAVTFVLGIPSLMGYRLPRDRYVPGFCRHKFAGALCGYVQPTYTRIGEAFSFIRGTAYHTIQCGTGNLIQNVFRHAPGGTTSTPGAAVWLWALSGRTGFTITGSTSNNQTFIANPYYAVTQLYVRVFTEAQGGPVFVEEAAGASVTLQLGFTTCNHSLADCTDRLNSSNYGGSPGIVGGVYG